MARDATARLYDVDADALTFKRLNVSEKYDHGVVTFQAKKGQWIDLKKLHESIWATRLSGGTSSGVVYLEATTRGTVVPQGSSVRLAVEGGRGQFELVDDVKAKPADAKKSVLAELLSALQDQSSVVTVTGYLEDWNGRWPRVLSQPPAKLPKLMVTSFDVAKPPTGSR